MSSATYAPSSGLRTYLTDVTNAARAFAAALFAAQERQFIAQQVPAKKATVSPRARLKNQVKLNALASSYERMHPGLANELRHLAGRD